MNDEILKEFESLVSQGEAQEGTSETPPPSGMTPAEEVLYFHGGKEGKLPLQAEIALKEDGKIARAPLGTILNHYRQRADLDKKSVELRKQREAWEQERGDIDTYKSLRQKYGAIQEWSEKNPEEFAHIWNLYENRSKHLLERDAGVSAEGGNGALPPAVIEKIASLEKTIEDLQGFKTSFEQTQEQKADEEAYSEVQQEMEQFKKDFPELNLDEQDEEGVALSKKILIHGVQKQIPEFRLAAFSFLGPKVMDALVQRGRNEAVKNVRQDRQQGVVSRSVTPPDGGQRAEVDTQKSWSDLHRDAKDELKQILGTT